VVIAALTSVAAIVAAPGIASVAAYHEPAEYFRLREPQIAESSGVAASSTRDGLYFTHNDSGDTSRFFAVDTSGCALVIFDLADQSFVAFDWEDLARGPGKGGQPSLWFGDIGDNLAVRRNVTVYRALEPKVRRSVDPATAECPSPKARTIKATAFDLTYEDGPHDAETVLVHPQTGQLFVVTKVGEGDAGVYAAPARLRSGRTNVLRRVASIPGRTNVTGGDIDPGGGRLVLRDYQDAFEYGIPDGDVAAAFAGEPRRIDLPAMPQGEAITYERDGSALVLTSEQAGSVVIRVPDHP
jgi:hypothetical protein